MTDLHTYGDESSDDEGYDAFTFESGVEKRLPVVLLLDTSSSMSPDVVGTKPIDELNSALRDWAAELHRDPQLRHRAELALISFGSGGVKTHRLGDGTSAFTPAALFQPPTLEAGGVTPMLEAIEAAIKLVANRKKELLGGVTRISYFRPLVFMITDGAPTDPSGHVLSEDAWRPTAREIAALEARKSLGFFAVGVSGAQMSTLKGLSPNSYWDLRTGHFADFLRVVSASAGEADPLTAAREMFMRMHHSDS